MKEYYCFQDIMNLTGFKKTKSTDLIVKLNELLKNEHPNVLIINGRVPIWFWEEKTKPTKKEIDVNEKEKKIN